MGKPVQTDGGNALQSDTASSLLPTRRLADDFLKNFWRYTHPLYPIVHQGTITNAYHVLWLSSSDKTQMTPVPFSESRVFWATLNVIFAMGCQFSDHVEVSQRVSLANEFYNRSQSISSSFVLEAATVESVQLLLLTSIYLQSTQHASRCWNTLGLAIRAAQAVGLHRDAECSTLLDREIGRRIWHNCVVLDRSCWPLFQDLHPLTSVYYLDYNQCVLDAQQC